MRERRRSHRQELGSRGEEIARRLLERHGYETLETNFRTRYGEIDIVARRGGIVVFVEVKARHDRSFGEPFEAVTHRKQNQVARMAEAWLVVRQNDENLQQCDFRFDVISILLGEDGSLKVLDHIEDAFRIG